MIIRNKETGLQVEVLPGTLYPKNLYEEVKLQPENHEVIRVEKKKPAKKATKAKKTAKTTKKKGK